MPTKYTNYVFNLPPDSPNVPNTTGHLFGHNAEEIKALEKLSIEINQFLKNEGLKIDDAPNEYNQYGNLIFNKQNQCLELQLKNITPIGANASHHATRDMIIQIYQPGSTLDPTFKDYQDRVHAIFNAARQLIEEELQDARNIDDQCQQLNDLEQQIQLLLNNLDPKNNENHYTAMKIISKAYLQSATILKNLEATCIKKKYEDNWIQKIGTREISMFSEKQRPIRANLFSIGKNSDEYMIEIAKPISNVSSLDRKGRDNILPNWWKSTSIYFKLHKNQVVEKGRIISDRSASVDAYEAPEKSQPNINEAIAEKNIRELAIRKIKNLLDQELQGKADKDTDFKQALGKVVSNGINIKLFQLGLVSLLNEDKIIEKNKIAYDAIKTLKFSDSDIKELLSYYPLEYTKNIATEIAQILKNTNINSKTICANYGTNIVRGLKHPIKPQKNLQKRYNDEAILDLTLALNSHLQTVINHEISNTQLHPSLLRLLEQTMKITNEIDRHNNIHKHWESVRDNFIRQIENSGININSSEKLKTTYNTLILYVQFMDNCSGHQPSALLSSDHSKNYVRQESAAALADALGFDVRVNCKSGKDRTGAYEIAKTAALKVRSDLKEQHENLLPIELVTNKNYYINNFEEPFWNNFSNVAQFALSRKIPSDNCPGSNGLQGMHQSGLYPKGIREKCQFEVQDKVSRLHKKPINIAKIIIKKGPFKLKRKIKVSKKDKALAAAQRNANIPKTSSKDNEQTKLNIDVFKQLQNTNDHKPLDQKTNAPPLVLSAFEQSAGNNQSLEVYSSSFHYQYLDESLAFQDLQTKFFQKHNNHAWTVHPITKQNYEQSFLITQTKQKDLAPAIEVFHSTTKTGLRSKWLDDSPAQDYVNKFTDCMQDLSHSIPDDTNIKYIEANIKSNDPDLSLQVFENILKKNDTAFPPLVIPKLSEDILNKIQKDNTLNNKYQYLTKNIPIISTHRHNL